MPAVLDRPYREDELRYLWRAGVKGSFEAAVAHNKALAQREEHMCSLQEQEEVGTCLSNERTS